MTIAVTADLHLTSCAEHPHRFAALEDILDQMLLCGAHTLVIAGDLFHADRRNFKEFEEVFKTPRHQTIRVVIIPGNHDSTLRQRSFSLPNLMVIEQPHLLRVEENGLPFLFLPYQASKSASEAIFKMRQELPKNEYVLISHGDYISGNRLINPIERGIYMPLARQDIDRFCPARVFLGHTHLPYESNPVISPGSPAAVDSTETGRRSFILYDPQTNLVERKFIRQGPIYMRESLVILPGENTDIQTGNSLKQRIRSWGFSESELRRVQLSLSLSGCSSDRMFLRETIIRSIEGISLFPESEPDLSRVLAEDDPALAAVAASALEIINGLALNAETIKPDVEMLQQSILNLVYGTE
jgi:DNA repair exonuclease SbcCD nuclease subunit